MGHTILEKIVSSHAGRRVAPGDFVGLKADVGFARDVGGVGVINALLDSGLSIHDRSRTFFSFDHNPMGSNADHAANQRLCRAFARDMGIEVFDIGRGIGTHLAMEEGLVAPGRTFVSADSHANLVGAVGAFGQGMGDEDIAHAFAFGSVWFGVPQTVKVVLDGRPGQWATPKDLALAMLKTLRSRGLLGVVAEVYGDVIESMSLSARITMASMGTEMGAIALIIPPSAEVLGYCRSRARWPFEPAYADADAQYGDEIVVDVSDLRPLIALPGRLDDVVEARQVEDRPINSVFIGSSGNGSFEDLSEAAKVLEGNRLARGVLLEVVPATEVVWKRCLAGGVLKIFNEAGALIGSPGCAGCYDGQVGGPCTGDVIVSTGNRNFPARKGCDVYLASPATAAASAVAGSIADVEALSSGRVKTRRQVVGPRGPAAPGYEAPVSKGERAGAQKQADAARPTKFSGRVWIIDEDNIDTDMIYPSNRLAVTDVAVMGAYAFGGIPGWEDFPSKAQPGDIVVAGRNFGCGSARQHAVCCLKSLGIAVIIARSFGPIFQRNAISAGLPVMTAKLAGLGLRNGDPIWIDVRSGHIDAPSRRISIKGTPFSKVQMDIYQRGGLFGAV